MELFFKEKLKEFIFEHLDNRILASEKAVKAAQDSANGESKSSAGDKYETGRAMAQNDRDMYAMQLHQAKGERNMLEKIRFEEETKIIRPGALTETSMGWFMIAISIGVATIEQQKIMIISPQSPIGEVLMGKSEGDSFVFRDKTFKIISVV
jgi:transcription elongation GreA/GreB family factor